MVYQMTKESKIEIYERIHNFCENGGYKGVSVDIIEDLFEDYNRNQIYRALEQLTEMGALEKDKNGKYVVYNPNPDWNP